MTTQHYTITGLNVQQDDDLWTVPVLADVDRGLLEPAELTFRVVDGRAVHPMHTGDTLDTFDVFDECNIWDISTAGSIRGWGSFDGPAYDLHGSLVPAAILDRIGEWTNLKLPELSNC